MQLVRFEGLWTERYEIKVINAAAGVIKSGICHCSEVQGENWECDNMINGTDHICDSLLIFKSLKGLNFADKACYNYFMSFKLGAAQDWRRLQVILLWITGACEPSEHVCIQDDRQKQAATDGIWTEKKVFTVSHDPGIFWAFKQLFGNKGYISFRHIASQRDLTSPLQGGKYKFSSIK